MLSSLYFYILIFISVISNIYAPTVSEGSIKQLQRYQIGYIARSSGINPLIPKMHIHAPLFKKPLNYQQKRHMGGVITAFTTAFAAIDTTIKTITGFSLAGAIIYNQQSGSNPGSSIIEQKNIAADCIQEVQQAYHVGMNDEDYKACEEAALEVIQQSHNMPFDEMKEVIKVKTKEILQESYYIRNPAYHAEWENFLKNQGQTTLQSSTSQNSSIQKAPCVHSTIAVQPTEKNSPVCERPPVVQKLEVLIKPSLPNKPELFINVPAESQKPLPGFQIIPEPKAEDFIIERREEKKPKKVDLEKPEPKKEKPKESNGERYDKTPRTHPELFKPIKGTPGKQDPDGNAWETDKSRHGGPHWDVLGADGKRLKEVAKEDGKVLSTGIKGDSSKFNSASTDRSTRGGPTPFPIKDYNASIAIGSVTALTAVNTHVSSMSIGGGSPQQNNGLSYTAIGNMPHGPHIAGNTPVIVTSTGIFVPTLNRSGASSVGGDNQAQVNAAFNQQPGVQMHKAHQGSTQSATKSAELAKAEIAKAFGDKKTSEAKEQTPDQSQQAAAQAASSTGQATPVSTQAAPTAAHVTATAAHVTPVTTQVNRGITPVTAAQVKSTAASASTSTSSGSSFAQTFALKYTQEQQKKRNYENDIKEYAERQRQERFEEWKYQNRRKEDDACTIS